MGAAQLVAVEVEGIAEGQLAALGQHPDVGTHWQPAVARRRFDAGRHVKEVEHSRVPLAAGRLAGSAAAGGIERAAIAGRMDGGQVGITPAERLQLSHLVGGDGRRLPADGTERRQPLDTEHPAQRGQVGRGRAQVVQVADEVVAGVERIHLADNQSAGVGHGQDSGQILGRQPVDDHDAGARAAQTAQGLVVGQRRLHGDELQARLEAPGDVEHAAVFADDDATATGVGVE